ncbi:hypothetical protein HPB52_018534 [Rhipicephalus sanguineus]|uniref:Uncharacterized protein n=1 Tax=Rhipicephalus sanguineus TaxID=34632 RepID=A0A9D4QH87_RHISA|nr:hypothetical protein HPB52_018534 [Rhipicephalus sanguineus]
MLLEELLGKFGHLAFIVCPSLSFKQLSACLKDAGTKKCRLPNCPGTLFEILVESSNPQRIDLSLPQDVHPQLQVLCEDITERTQGHIVCSPLLAGKRSQSAMPGEKKRMKYWNLSMDDLNTDSVDTQDTDVLELYRKGLEDYRDLEDNKSERRADETRAVALAYEKISEAEAAILWRLLRSRRVEELCLYDISLCAFKLAFENLEQCPSLSSMYIHLDLQGKEFGTSFSGVFTSLHSLELSCDNTGSGFAYQIASYIRQNKTLRELRLRNSCGGDEGAAVLIEALQENDTLKIFALNNIKSSSDTLVGFAKMLATNRTLEMVHLGPAMLSSGDLDETARCSTIVNSFALASASETLAHSANDCRDFRGCDFQVRVEYGVAPFLSSLPAGHLLITPGWNSIVQSKRLHFHKQRALERRRTIAADLLTSVFVALDRCLASCVELSEPPCTWNL